MEHFTPDALSYSIQNSKKIAEIEELLNTQPLLLMLTLLKQMNEQMKVLETKIELLKEENN